MIQPFALLGSVSACVAFLPSFVALVGVVSQLAQMGSVLLPLAVVLVAVLQLAVAVAVPTLAIFL